MAASALSNRLVSPISLPSKPKPKAISLQPKFSLVKFPNTRFHPLSRKTTSLTTFCSSDAPQHDTPIELRYPAFPTVMDINQIRDILPHRFPFLLVDRVIEYNPGVSAVAIKNVTINDNFFPGHFPERPIMPGVLMVEELSQPGMHESRGGILYDFSVVIICFKSGHEQEVFCCRQWHKLVVWSCCNLKWEALVKTSSLLE
uniref:Beta-hydroxyacyl-ACP dehydratase n=1 Tax=Glycine max TaxID=3847 RepID=K7L7E6_SOYBN